MTCSTPAILGLGVMLFSGLAAPLAMADDGLLPAVSLWRS
jgi:hypothetical protein